MASLFGMYQRYDSLTGSERLEINDLLVTWIDKTDVDSDELYIALACVTEFKISTAIPAMERLYARLQVCKIPDHPQGYHA